MSSEKWGKIPQSKENGETVCNINGVVRGSLSEKLTLGRGFEGEEGRGHRNPLGKREEGGGNSKCKGSEEREHLKCAA